MAFRDDLIKDHIEQLKEKEGVPPPQYVLVLHMNPAAYCLSLHVSVQHVLEQHMSINAADTEKAIKGAANCGKAVIRPITKDVGESLMQRASECLVMTLSSDFKVALEQA